MNKIYNTLKMMGVNGRQALEFNDAISLFNLTINPEVKKSQRDTMLGTIIMDKTVKQWFEHYAEIGRERGIRYFDGSDMKPIVINEIDFERIEGKNVRILLELVLQEYYKKEGFVI